MLKFLFKIKITIVLKSGEKISFYCKNMKITKNGNDITGYDIDGGDGKMFYCRLSEIAAILKK